MKPKERVLAVISGESTDKVPVHHIQFSGHAASVILGREAYVGGAIQQWREMNSLWEGEDAHAEFLERSEQDAVAVAKACEHDILRLGYWRWNQRPIDKVDDYTFVFEDEQSGRYTLTYDPELELLTRKNPKQSVNQLRISGSELDKKKFQQAVQSEEEKGRSYQPRTFPEIKKATVKYCDYLLKTGCGAVNVDISCEEELMATALWPDLMARYLMAKAMPIISDIPGLAAAGVEVCFNSMDFASKLGPLISPTVFSDVVAPALKAIVDACHARGIKYFYGSDGNLWPVADAMFDTIGIDGYFEIDASAGMDLVELRKRFPKTTLVGNIQVQTVQHGSTDDVEREVMRCLETAHELGKIVVGVSNMIMPGTPP